MILLWIRIIHFSDVLFWHGVHFNVSKFIFKITGGCKEHA